MDEKLTLLSHKVEQTHSQVVEIQQEVKKLTADILKHDKDISFIHTRLKAQKEDKVSKHDLNGRLMPIPFLNDEIKDLAKHNKEQDKKIISHEMSIDRLISTTENLAKSSDKVIRKLDSMTTPKTIGFIMGAVVAFCGFVLGVVKLLSMI